MSAPASADLPAVDPALLALPGLGPARARAYAAAGLGTARSILYHLPVRYRLRPAARPLGEWGEEQAGRAALVGEVRRASVRRRGRRSTVSLELRLDDGARCTALIFNRAYLAKGLPRGTRAWVAGRLQRAEDGTPRLLVADYEVLAAGAAGALPPLPIYRLPVGVPPRVHRKVVEALLEEAPIADWRDALPDSVAIDRSLPALGEALAAIHAPADVPAARAARRRLAHDEAFALSLAVAERRRRAAAGRAPVLAIDAARHRQLLGWLPHAPTAAQARVIDVLREELSQPAGGRPMSRLLQGDVGSGKTLVAVYALLAALAAGRQAALMAPTEILAAQHAATLRALLARAVPDAASRVVLLTGGSGGAEPRAALARGRAALAIGTHALQTARTKFADLALTIIDEQHRFGVVQRGRLREKGDHGHLLVMTATPIPRTLALTAWGELDVSVIDELPPGRAPRTTRLVEGEARRALWAELRAAVARGERGYVVCPSIGGSGAAADDGAPDHSVAATKAKVASALGAAVRVGAVHGRLAASERDAVLDAFREGALDVLVATVLVEVGLDVPEASWVVIPDPARFGLAQMHQIRGRVGRGGRPGLCVLLGPVPEGPARARVEALLATDDGFLLAELDLSLRGPGEVLGTAQSGLPDFLALDPVRDVELLANSRAAAFAAAQSLSDRQLRALGERVFPAVTRRPEQLLAGG